jgi:hypothetical protein
MDGKAIQILHAVDTILGSWLRLPDSSVKSAALESIYHLWQASVAVHALMQLVSLHSPRHLTQLQIALNQSLAYTFHISVTAVPYLFIDLGLPPTSTCRPQSSSSAYRG